jgi:ankyrin repeat protein
MESLPFELSLAILAEVPARDLFRLDQVSRYFYDLTHDPMVWSMKAWHDFGFPQRLFQTFTDPLTGSFVTDPRRRYGQIRHYWTNWYYAIAKACDRGNLELVKYLVTRQYQRSHTNLINLQPALARAAYHGHGTIVRFLMESPSAGRSTLAGTDGRIRLKKLQWALTEAARGNHEDIITYLMTMPSSQQAIQALPIRTCLIRPLNHSARQGNLKLVKYFIDQGVSNLEPALRQASLGGHIDVVNYLIDRGARDFNPALEQACAGGHLEVVKLLVAQGTRHPWAMDYAARQGHFDIVKYLLDHSDKNGWMINWMYRAIRLAVRTGYFDVFKSMITPPTGSREIGQFLGSMAGHGQLEAVKYCLNLDVTPDDLEWALTRAARKGHLEVVKYLLAHGATNVDNALLAAIQGGHLPIVIYVIQSGATTIQLAHHLAQKWNYTHIVTYLERYLTDHARNDC